MALFKGFNQVDLLREEPRVLCAILGAQLSLTNQAVETLSQEIRDLKHQQKNFEDEVVKIAGDAGLITKSKPEAGKE